MKSRAQRICRSSYTLSAEASRRLRAFQARKKRDGVQKSMFKKSKLQKSMFKNKVAKINVQKWQGMFRVYSAAFPQQFLGYSAPLLCFMATERSRSSYLMYTCTWNKRRHLSIAYIVCTIEGILVDGLKSQCTIGNSRCGANIGLFCFFLNLLLLGSRRKTLFFLDS